MQSTGWGIIAQRPTGAIDAKLTQLARTTLLNAVPFALISLAVFWWLSRLISRPIRAWPIPPNTGAHRKPPLVSRP